MSHQPERRELLYLPLRGLSLASSTQQAYSKQLGSFLSYSGLGMRSFLMLRAAEIDRALAVYIQVCYDARSSFTYVAQALSSAVHHRPDLRPHLPISRQCLRGWNKVREAASHPPLTWEVTVVMACTMARSGYPGPAVALLLAFDCFLRVGELTRIRFTDVVMPNDPRMGRAHTSMAVVLRTTKTGKMQSVEIWNPQVARVVAEWSRLVLSQSRSSVGTSSGALDPDPRIFSFSPDFFRRLMHRTSVALQLPVHYTPHSLRHGGATDDFLRNGSIERVQFRGRWKQLESVRRYVQTARAMLAAQQVPRQVNELGILLDRDLAVVLLHLIRTIPVAAIRSGRHAENRRVTFHLPADSTH